MATTAPSFERIAKDLGLWREWADPDRAISDEEFDELTTERKIEILTEVWGD